MSAKLRVGGVLAGSIVLTTMIGVAPARAADGCGENSCRISADATTSTSSSSSSSSTTTTTTTTTTPTWIAGPGTPSKAAAKPAGLTAAQKQEITNRKVRRETWGATDLWGCGDPAFPGVAAACPEPEPTEPTVQQASTTNTTTTTRTRRQRTVSVRELAEKARSEITFEKPDIGSAPCSDANCQGAVGVPVWLWTQDFPSQTESASAGGRTVRVTDEVTKVTWDLGDGTSITCNSSGTRYDRSIGWATSPDCGVPNGYSKAGRYTVTATFHHEISYSGAPLPSETATSTASVPVVIGEYQGVGVRAGGA